MRIKLFPSFFLFLFLAVATSSGLAADQSKIVVMNPRGIKPEIRKIPMAPRPATLEGETVYIVDTKYPNTKPFVNELYSALKSKYPAAELSRVSYLALMFMAASPIPRLA